ncbi:MAG: DUF3347 domain-containing protein [Phycisphaerales bacterium]|nr:MAG: DUF3347 domain-containing protein [Phycisphaerales bacterium]
MNRRAPVSILRRVAAHAGTIVLVLVLLIVAFVLGRQFAPRAESANGAEAPASAADKTVYTCSMHPQIRMDRMGQCPICFMDLIPAGEAEDDDEDGVVRVRFGATARALADVRTSRVERRPASVELRLFGRIETDETRIRDLVVLTDGVIERLHANYVGAPVRVGDVIAEFYSPDVLTAAYELVAALDTRRQSRVDPALDLVETSRQKLRLLGVTDADIDEVVRTGLVKKTFRIHSPATGVITMLGGHEGHWLDRGEDLAEITDYTGVWALLDAYERDLPLLRYAQPVIVTTDAVPGREFRGVIAYIPPAFDEMTRSVKVRLNVPNADGALKPGMYVRARVESRVDDAGHAIGPDLRGKWISPMHPEIVKDEPGACDVCGMALEPAEQVLAGAGGLRAGPHTDPLLIPASAPLITGRRALVYVEAEQGVFEARDVRLGSRVGDAYVVLDGLSEGERVVTTGAFKIDSAAQIAGKHSLMSPAREPSHAPRHRAPASFLDSLPALYKAYFAAQEALADDDFFDFLDATEELHSAAMRVDDSGLFGAPRDEWRALRERLAAGRGGLDDLLDIGEARALFETHADAMIALVRTFGRPGGGVSYIAHCPMAFDGRRAEWLARQEEIANPYFGASMLRCGVVDERVPALGAPHASPPPARDQPAQRGHEGHGHE